MPEPEEETNKSNGAKDQQQAGAAARGGGAADMLMDLDLDLESLWPFDQTSSPLSPFLQLPFPDQPCSPLWAFPDNDGDKLATSSAAASASASASAAGQSASVTGGGGNGLRLSEHAIFLTRAPSSVRENTIENKDNRKLPSPFLGSMPSEYPDGYCIIKERMTQALRYFKESTEQHVLAQVWAPVKNGRDRYVLTTSGQPFFLDPQSIGLHQYRIVSLTYMFSVDGDSDGELGLPGRVFWQKLPEWTPNVQYYTSKEFPRLNHALNYNVRGTLALPVFEPSGQSCVGVLELIMTSPKINYAPEVDKVCKALEAVNLRSSEILTHHPSPQICNEGRKNALAEILEILTVVCETHKLPLAQTWVPCMHRSVLANGGGLKKICTSFDGSCNVQVCMSTTDVAFYVVDARMWGFREACLEHHLQKGQGVAGRAFLSHNSCFCCNITQFCKTEYPLVHYARMFGLTGGFAVCLRSGHTGDDDYILEFFLPPSIVDSSEQETLLGSLLATMKQHFQSLKVASGMDLEEEEGFVEIIEGSGGKLDMKLECIQIPQSKMSPPHTEPLPNARPIMQLDPLKQQSMANFYVDNGGSTVPAKGSNIGASLPGTKEKQKTSERKRGKTEKTISLEVLQQYFAGSLKDAAKSLGVCPTTMKRICRQHGIARWPSRKINKVNRSLSKLKRVIESVQGADGAFGDPLSTNPLPVVPVAVNNISWPSNMNGCNRQNSPNSKLAEPEGDNSGSPHGIVPVCDGQVGVADQLLAGTILSQEVVVQKGVSPELAQGSSRSKSGSASREGSAGTPTSHGSCQGSPSNESAAAKDTSVSPVHDQRVKSGSSPESTFQPTGELHCPGAYSIPEALVAAEAQETFERRLIEDSGSSKDLRNLCPSVADAIVDERVPESSWRSPPCTNVPMQSAADPPQTLPQFMARQEVRSLTIKATHREDIIRFRISQNSRILELKEEVARRLKLEVGTFDIKYLDDDHEWVLIACDSDLQECLDISTSSGINIIRLLINDVNANLGSSCESTGEL